MFEVHAKLSLLNTMTTMGTCMGTLGIGRNHLPPQIHNIKPSKQDRTHAGTILVQMRSGTMQMQASDLQLEEERLIHIWCHPRTLAVLECHDRLCAARLDGILSCFGYSVRITFVSR